MFVNIPISFFTVLILSSPITQEKCYVGPEGVLKVSSIASNSVIKIVQVWGWDDQGVRQI